MVYFFERKYSTSTLSLLHSFYPTFVQRYIRVFKKKFILFNIVRIKSKTRYLDENLSNQKLFHFHVSFYISVPV